MKIIFPKNVTKQFCCSCHLLKLMYLFLRHVVQYLFNGVTYVHTFWLILAGDLDSG
jgi:hypothetical protein